MESGKFILLEDKNQTLKYLEKIKEFEEFMPITFNFECERLLAKNNINFKIGGRYEIPALCKNLQKQAIELTEKICSKISISYRDINLLQLFYSDLTFFFISSIKYLKILKKIKTKEKIKEILIFKNINFNITNEICSKIATEIFKNNSKTIEYASSTEKNPWFMKFAGYLQNFIAEIKLNLTEKNKNKIFFCGNKNIFENVIKELNKNKKNEIFRCNNRLQKSFFINKRYIPSYRLKGIKTKHQKGLIKEINNFNKKTKDLEFLKNIDLEDELIPIVKSWIFYYLKFKFLEISKIIDHMIKLIKKNKISLILLDADVNFFEKTFAQVGKRFNLPSIVVQHGVIGNKRGFLPSSADFFLSFGEKSKEYLIKYGYEKDKIIITGSPQFDKYFNLEIPEKNKKKIIFIMSTYSSKDINPEMEIPSQGWKDIYRMLFNSLKKFPGYELIIKSKGKGELEDLPRTIAEEIGIDVQRIKIIERISPIELMKDTEMVIVTDSTMAFDALLLNKKVISIWFKKYERFFNYKDTNPIDYIINQKELEKAIKKSQNLTKKESIEKRKSINKELYKQDGKASERIVAFINKLLKNKEEPYNVALILAHKLDKNQNLTKEGKQRVDLGIKNYFSGRVKKLIMSGGHESFGEKYGISLAEAMKKYALKKGVPEIDIFKEELSLETVGQLIFSKIRIIDLKQFKNILIISNDYHIERIKAISRVVFNNNYLVDFEGVETSLTQEKKQEIYDRERKSEGVFKKTFDKVTLGNNEELLKILLERHLSYNKTPQYFK
jgi:vancomycin permeability regulator SanA